MDELRKRLRKQRLKFHRFFLGEEAPLWMQSEGFCNCFLPTFPTGKPVEFQLQGAAQLARIRFFLPLSVGGLAVAYVFLLMVGKLCLHPSRSNYFCQTVIPNPTVL